MPLSKVVLPALTLLVLAAVPRFVGLDALGFTLDELRDTLDAARYVDSPQWSQPISGGYLNGQLPFFLIWLSGLEPMHGRLLSAASGVVCVILVWLISVRRYGPATGAIAAGLMALSPFHTSASRLAFSHGHVLAGPTILLALLFLSRTGDVTKIRTRDVGLAAFFLGMAFGTDLLAAHFVLAFSFVVLINMCRRRNLASAAMLASVAYLGIIVGFGVASPMYLVDLEAAVQDVTAKISWWDNLTGYLWLGQKVERIPAVFYVVVLVVKLVPPMICLAALGLLWTVRETAVLCFREIITAECDRDEKNATAITRTVLNRKTPRRSDGFFLFCAGTFLFALAMLSFKGWKNPYYLIPYLPLLYLLVAVSVTDCWQRVAHRSGKDHSRNNWRIFRSLTLASPRRGEGGSDSHFSNAPNWMTSMLLGLTMAWQTYALVVFFPDYPMLGIQYHSSLYGEFQGPAVSHGQWTDNGMQFVAEATQANPKLLVPSGVSHQQLNHFSRQHGITLGSFENDNLESFDFVMITIDARRMHAPLLQDVPKQNQALLNAVESGLRTGHLKLVKTFGCCGPRMIEIYEVVRPDDDR